MRRADIDAAGPGDYEIDYGNPVYRNTDESENDLFINVNETLFERPVYATLLALVEQRVFEHDVGEEHSHSFEELKEFLFNFWFGSYSRCSGTQGSSGDLRTFCLQPITMLT
ncbi:unnamed protein product [Strongylus vulgaris]|uniref:EndoU domain-containing protein n=1 Tax=Strongylus vulgaris TaxID=40348 RepID=A0A3P7J1Y4_STRVU|nr:unnamed protein product [Strongylus vulgaris]